MDQRSSREADDPEDPADLGFPLPQPARVTTAGVASAVAIGGTLALAAFLSAYLPKRQEERKLAANTILAEHRSLRVDVVSPKVLSSDRSIVLPGSIQPLEDTIIYPRANGYIRRFVVDIGDRVKEGQLLAEIETPELDEELDQARASLAQAVASLNQAKANRDFSTANLARYKVLTPEGLTSQQDLDQRRAQSLVDEATVGSAEAGIGVQRANLERLLQLKSFGRVLAPFDGVIASRSIARGALVTEGNGTPLFRIVSTDPVRVLVQVPQDVAPGVRANAPAKVTLREFAGRTFAGVVSRAAGALDPATRTMTTEVRVPNPKNELLTGMYAEVLLSLPISHRVLELPATALMNDANGLRVAVVGDEDKLRLVHVTLERDAGATVQIASGLDGTERVVRIASAELTDGMTVDVRK